MIVTSRRRNATVTLEVAVRRPAPFWYRPEKPPAITTPPNWCANCGAAGPNAISSAARGPHLREAGVRPVIRSEDLSVVGIVEVVGHLPRIWRRFRELIAGGGAGKARPCHPHRLPGFPFSRGQEAEAARNPGGLPGRPAGLGVAERPREDHAAGDRPAALHFPFRRGVFPRTQACPSPISDIRSPRASGRRFRARSFSGNTTSTPVVH